MYLIELIRRFSRVGDTVGGAFGGSGTACLAANIEKRSSIYIDIDSKQDQMCRPRWQRAQQKIMAEHMMHIRRSMQDYVKRLEDRPWLFPSPTGFKHTPAKRFNKPIMDKTAELVKGGGLKQEMMKYNESFSTVFTDPFCRTYIHPASSAPGSTPDWLLQPAAKQQAVKKKKKVTLRLALLFEFLLCYIICILILFSLYSGPTSLSGTTMTPSSLRASTPTRLYRGRLHLTLFRRRPRHPRREKRSCRLLNYPRPNPLERRRLEQRHQSPRRVQPRRRRTRNNLSLYRHTLLSHNL